MRKIFLTVVLFTVSLPLYAATPDWTKRLADAMPLLGHRNWILVVDSAYPLQISPGVETIETNASQLDVVRAVLREIDKSIHVRPTVFMDSELPLISDSEAPGVAAYRTELGDLLHNYPVRPRLHEKIISDIEQAGKSFHVLVLKTNMTIPYTSVFIRLDCKYWSNEQERNLRAKMGDTRMK